MPISALVGQIIARLVGEGYGEQDFAALISMQAGAAGSSLATARHLRATNRRRARAAQGYIYRSGTVRGQKKGV